MGSAYSLAPQATDADGDSDLLVGFAPASAEASAGQARSAEASAGQTASVLAFYRNTNGVFRDVTDEVMFTIHRLGGQEYVAMNAGPMFKFNESISFMVYCDTQEEIDYYWEKLSAVPEAEQCGWLKDKYGLSWQLILTSPEGDERPRIVPSLLFTGDRYGRAEEALKFYCSVFPGSEEGMLVRYGADNPPNEEGTVMFADCKLLGTWLAIMDGAGEHDFRFNEAISFMVSCKTQKEIDSYWDKLSAVPEAEQCGWLKDRFGVSWQVFPSALMDMLQDKDRKRADRVMQAMLQMKKMDLEALEQAYAG